jgi:hypothetical protein
MRVNRWAWEKSKGVNAISDRFWGFRVLSKECLIEDFAFESPRPKGVAPKPQYDKMSKNRLGDGNPAFKNIEIYDMEELKIFAQHEFQKLGNNERRFRLLENILREKFPDFRYNFYGKFRENDETRGHNSRNKILAFLLDKDIFWIVDAKAKDRGKLIKVGQDKSPKKHLILNAGKNVLKGHTSLPHKILYNMVKFLDPMAKIEKQIDYRDTWKSYDIYSPEKNILIEMHGHMWHDTNKCKKNLIPLVFKNVKNDEIKKELALLNSFRYEVFWDDQTDMWENKLEEIYGRKSKTYEEAFCEENNKKRTKKGI